ncbi:helix-turn-helix domain-containing protein [Chitinophaga nivalis]|uniref:Helix-turn-helix domain-containing protein n=1 Tax=Chitinophaga nivalis TaxID=2991709 RepID=A0ABT3ISH3_9BACT|nr:helix-turn-helix domain-containing protein [Chitinophaga nivalis]MCW3463464.1 helix-turn-helix domain-containing protein [Chitinophaga nivalis]MCW3486846.1 helix-turn-helix domain-containing protein [Chitinophaga nivalis]
MSGNLPLKIKGISQLLQLRGLPKSKHPLIAVFDIATIKELPNHLETPLTTDFYFIGLKQFLPCVVKMKYGQQEQDFDEGQMRFIAPGQVFSYYAYPTEEINQSGWLLLVHPDFLWNSPLAKKIKQYEFFGYSMHEALFLSEQEELTMKGLFRNIEQEYSTNIDQFSQGIIISLIESLLGYAERFYQRQFITRKITHHSIANQLEALLEKAFTPEILAQNGIPTVKYISGQLNISPNYLSSLLKMLTGNSTQQHIQEKIIEKAKERLVTTDLSVNEIAFELGFEYPQSFSKLFRTKTNYSPLAFRKFSRH